MPGERQATDQTSAPRVKSRRTPSPSTPLRIVKSPPNNLPIQLTSFIGREREAAEIKRILLAASPLVERRIEGDGRLLTLTGAGGSGKSRLALQVAAELVATEGPFFDGVWLVELAALIDPTLMPQAVASALGVREQPGRGLTDTLVDYLKPQATLMVLDNCEHLSHACATLARHLLLNCPGLCLLVTSQSPLYVIGETVWPVPPLSLPDAESASSIEQLTQSEAVRLFVTRAQATLPDFRLTAENGVAISQICHRLDGIPLALELAAARIKLLTAPQIVARLDDAFRLLTRGGQSPLPRHQTLRATADWSHSLLSTSEQALLRRLTVFAGGFTLEAAEQVCSDLGAQSADVLDNLTDLVDKSLVLVAERQPDGEARYRLLETIRQYGAEKLAEAGETQGIRQRHAEFFLLIAERAEPELKGPQQVAWLSRLEQEHDNLRAALAWARDNGAVEFELRLSALLAWFWYRHGYFSEGRGALEAALGRGKNASAMLRANALCGAGRMTFLQSDYAAARGCFSEALALYQETGDDRGSAFALCNLGLLARYRGDLDQARALLEEGLAFYRDIGDIWGSAFALSNMAGLYLADAAREMAYLEEGLALARRVGDKWLTAIALSALGEVARMHGDDDRAAALYSESLNLCRELGEKESLAWSLHNLGYVVHRQGDHAQAAMLFAQSLNEFQTQGSQFGLALCLAGLAGLIGGHGQAVAAVRVLGAAETLRAATGGVMEAPDRAEYERSVAALRSQLDETRFAVAWAAGQAMSLEQAVAYALETIDKMFNPSPPQGQKEGMRQTMAHRVSSPVSPLTRREREVAVLVADGLTNDDIAARLYVSTKTVEKHVGNILGKLGYERRAQVAAWAVEHGLTHAPPDLDDRMRRP